MEASFFKRHPLAKDAATIALFVVLVVVGTIFLNTFIFRSFNVVGPSMEPTMYTGDRLIVNRLPVTWENLKGSSYMPPRGEVIVFKNPHHYKGIEDEFIVKRVIGLPGERVTVKNGVITVYNIQHPAGFQPDDTFPVELSAPSGDVDTTVPANELFVVGDHREGSYSYDSRSGLGTIPLYDIIGPVSVRVFPFNKISWF